MRITLKITGLILFSVLFIYFMDHNKILDFSMLKHAFQEQKKIILVIAFLQIINFFFMTLRYYNLLKMFAVKAKFSNVLAASFVSNGLGQWMPGSLAVIEFLRISLMFGVTKDNETDGNLSQLTLRSKLTAISLLDRLIGLFVMLFFGSIVTAYICFFSDVALNLMVQRGVFSLLLFSLALCALIVLLFILPKSMVFRRIFERIERKFLLFFHHGFLNRFFRRIFNEFSTLFDAIALGSKKISSLWPSFIYSFICLLIISLGTYLAGIAVSGDLPFTAILATVSFLSLATLVPLSFGGIGWVQMVTVFVLSFYNVSPQSASSAQLLQTMINLLAGTAGVFFFIRFGTKRIFNLLLVRKN